MAIMNENRILTEIATLAVAIQIGMIPGSGVHIYIIARKIEWLSEILRFKSPHTVDSFFKWLDTDYEKEYYHNIILGK